MNNADSKGKSKNKYFKKYSKGIQINALMGVVDYVYELTGEIKATANELDMHPDRVKKLLITSEKISYPETSQIQRLQAYGMKMEDIQKELNLKKSALNSYLPYSKVPYKERVISANAERCDLYRKRKEAVSGIVDAASLMTALRLFQGYPFKGINGNVFKYAVLEEAGDVSGLQVNSAENNQFIGLNEVLSFFEKSQMPLGSHDTVGDEKIDNTEEFLEVVFKRFSLLR
ncbi:MAG: hypothetical protein MJ131_06185 [Lachnospiraceae bacterium]|nr:hypothetical protein [Lachnospiraceae bacterium]